MEAKGTPDAAEGGDAKGDFSWGDQMGPMVSSLQAENADLRTEVDAKKAQLKKMGIMLNALEPIPGVDAEKLLQALDPKGDPLHKDMKDVKIITMAKKLRGLQYELNKERGMNKKAQEVRDTLVISLQNCPDH